jgi:Fe-S-cluster-containing dehydrogenase component
MMAKVFIFDAEKCNGCCGCQIACKDEHCDNDWSPYAKPQPETGQFWCKVDKIEHGQVPVVRLEYNARLCNHCDNAPCIKVAADAVYKRDDGLVIIDPEKAQGRKDLVEACPYGAIYWNDELAIPQKCTGCAHLVDAGEKPRCADYCQTGGLRFGDEDEFVQEIAQAEVLLPENECGPRVYYINLPKLFVAGNVWDPECNENIEGARIALTNEASGETLTTETDDFGDFIFRRIDEGSYTLVVGAAGFFEQVRVIDLNKSRYVGDFPLRK